MTNVGQKIIIGLDVPSANKALAIVDRLKQSSSPPWGYKVGPELPLAFPSFLPAIREEATNIFLDHKWFNTPDVVRGLVTLAGEMGIAMCNINLESNGPETISAAVEAAAKYPEMKLLGVAVLTSRDDKSLAATGVSRTCEEQMLHLLGLGVKLGVTGFVTSGLEVSAIRREFGEKLHLVVPGTRSQGVDVKDQKRIVTPSKALEDGADQLVIASQVVKASDPLAAYENLLKEIAPRR